MKAIKFAEDDKTREKAQKIVQDLQLLPKAKHNLENRKDELDINK